MNVYIMTCKQAYQVLINYGGQEFDNERGKKLIVREGSVRKCITNCRDHSRAGSRVGIANASLCAFRIDE